MPTTNIPAKYQVNLGAHNSLETGNPFFVADFAKITASLITGAAVASQVTIVGSNLDGFQSTLSTALRTASNNTWSIITTLTAPGTFVIDPGVRWLMGIRTTSQSGQTASQVTLIFSGSH